MLKEQLNIELNKIENEMDKIEEWCNENINHKRYDEGCKKIQTLLEEAAIIFKEIID